MAEFRGELDRQTLELQETKKKYFEQKKKEQLMRYSVDDIDFGVVIGALFCKVAGLDRENFLLGLVSHPGIW